MITCRKCQRIKKRGYQRIGLSSIIGKKTPHAWLCEECLEAWKKFFYSFKDFGVKNLIEWDECWKEFLEYNPSRRSN